jgi:hypothetical protein
MVASLATRGEEEVMKRTTTVAALTLALAACGGEKSESPEGGADQEGSAEQESAAEQEAAEAQAGEAEVPAAAEPESEVAAAPVDGYVVVDGQEMPLAEIRCSPVGGSETWRVAASFDIIPENRDQPGRYYFDVRSRVDDDGQADPVTRTGQPDVTLQFPRDDGPTPDAFVFFTADSRFRGGDTTQLEFSTAGSSGTIEVQRQFVQAHEVSEEGPEPELKTVQFALHCP